MWVDRPRKPLMRGRPLLGPQMGMYSMCGEKTQAVWERQSKVSASVRKGG